MIASIACLIWLRRRHDTPAVASNAADVRMRREDAANLLCEYGIAPTVQRIEIAAVLLVRPQHVCAEELQRMLATHGTTCCGPT